MSSKEAFIVFNKEDPTYVCGSFGQVHPGMPQNCHCLEDVGNSPISFSRPTLTPKGMVVLLFGFSYYFELGTLS